MSASSSRPTSNTENIATSAENPERLMAMAGVQDELSALDNVVAQNETRAVDIEAWLEDQFPQLTPRDLAVHFCIEFELDMKQAGVTDFDITSEPPDVVQAFLSAEIKAHKAETRLNAIESAVQNNQADDLIHKSASLGELDDTATMEHLATDGAKDRNQATALELAQLQSVFEIQRRNHGTITALAQIMTNATLPEVKARIAKIYNTALALQTALPGREHEITTLINSSPLNLAAPDMAGTFGAILGQAAASGDFTTAEITVLRQTIQNADSEIVLASDITRVAQQTLVDPVSGEPMAIHTADQPAVIAPGVTAFTGNGRDVFLELHEGDVHYQIDVTALDSTAIGIVAEILTLSAQAARLGATVFVEELYGVDLAGFIQDRFDPITVSDLRKRLTALLGEGASKGGALYQPEKQGQLTLAQMQLLLPDGGGADDASNRQHIRNCIDLWGLDNLDILRAFGRFTRFHVGQRPITPTMVHHYLHHRFPDLVSMPLSDNALDQVV